MIDVYALSDAQVLAKIGQNLRQERLRQNITQESLALSAGISLSSVKKIEKGEIGSFDSLVRVLRILGKLGDIAVLIQEEEMSPNEYFEFLNSLNNHRRKRASSGIKKNAEETSSW